MPKEDAEGLSRPVASMVVAPTPAPRAFNISAIASATTAPAMTAPHDIREGSEGAPSGTTAVVAVLPETRVCILGSSDEKETARQGGADNWRAANLWGHRGTGEIVPLTVRG